MNVEAEIQFLAEGSLNLYAVFDCSALPKHIMRMMENSGVPLAAYGKLEMTGHGGQRFVVARKTNMASPLPRYFGFGRGLNVVTWTSDQLSQYIATDCPQALG